MFSTIMIDIFGTIILIVGKIMGTAICTIVTGIIFFIK